MCSLSMEEQYTFFAKIVFIFQKRDIKTQGVAVLLGESHFILSEKWTILFKKGLLPYCEKWSIIVL